MFMGALRAICQQTILWKFWLLSIMEVLSHILKKTEDGGFIQGFLVGPVNFTGIRVSHLLFVDDTILFCDASRE